MLVGEVVNESGIYAPVSFLIAAIIATFTAFTYAELSSRFPRSAGEAYYTQQAFNNSYISGLIGWSIVMIGLVSSATIVNGFVGYFNVYVDAPPSLTIFILVMVISAVAVWGISESVWLAAIITIIEVSGLLFVIFVAFDIDQPQALHVTDMIPSADVTIWIGVLIGAFLAFYAYIGFEDMVNVAEEVIHPQQTLPLAIIIALVASTILYVSVTLAAVFVLPVDQLAASRAPLVDIVRQYSESAVVVMGMVSMIAVVNGALIQVIMASRVVYGMACQNMAPKLFTGINAKTQTPIRATIFVTVIVLALALSFSLVTLAKATSFVTLLVFAAMHLALLVIKRREPDPANALIYPAWIPAVGFFVSLMLLMFQLWATK